MNSKDLVLRSGQSQTNRHLWSKRNLKGETETFGGGLKFEEGGLKPSELAPHPWRNTEAFSISYMNTNRSSIVGLVLGAGASESTSLLCILVTSFPCLSPFVEQTVK
ncbi:hypothetical protein TNCV_4012451 [Trichonephila clavipes]|nr:hypothetical protein TNCV_4012451 [Trichonephila clavipes]